MYSSGDFMTRQLSLTQATSLATTMTYKLIQFSPLPKLHDFYLINMLFRVDIASTGSISKQRLDQLGLAMTSLARTNNGSHEPRNGLTYRHCYC